MQKNQTDKNSPIAENKKEEMSDYMKKAIEKIHTYLPPAPEKIQKNYSFVF